MKPNVDAVNMSQEYVDETAKREHVYFQFAPVHEPVTMANHEIKGWPDDTKWRTYPKVQPEQEPYGYFGYDFRLDAWIQNPDDIRGIPFYTAPPKREWVGLTDEDKEEIKNKATYNWDTTAGEYASEVQDLTEAKLKEKNG